MEIGVKSIDEAYEELEKGGPGSGRKQTGVLAVERGKGTRRIRSREEFRSFFRDPIKEHQTKIAESTLKMPDAMAGVMGGPSKKEAKEFLGKSRYQIIGRSIRDDVNSKYYPITKSIAEMFETYGVNDTLDVFETIIEDGLSKGKVFDPAAVAAVVGRKKYGEKKFAEMAAAGRRRKGRVKEGKQKPLTAKGKARPGGGGRFAKLEAEVASKNK